MMNIVPLKYEDDRLFLLDQTKLPGEEVFVEIKTAEDIYDAIKKLVVRGAPAIGVAAAYGLYVSMRGYQRGDISEFLDLTKNTANYINSSRPTAVNLSWALKRVLDRIASSRTVSQAKAYMLDEAEIIRRMDVESCLAMGELGLSLLKPKMGILTHCNAGTIATAQYGTCLAPIHLGQERGYDFKVFADETRPLLQGARLTSWELEKAGVDVTLICDNMAATVMKEGKIDAVVVGCDRMAANGDGANKIGTLQVAVLAKEYGIPFYMFVPTSTIDLDTKSGADIEIELRDAEEIKNLWYEKQMAPDGVKAYNPAFDVTDNKYITAVITEKSIVRPPFDKGLREVMNRK